MTIEYKHPLIRAAYLNEVGSLRFLIGQGLDLDEQCPVSGDTALHAAHRGGSGEAIDMLLANGASTEIRNFAGEAAHDLPVVEPRADRLMAGMEKRAPELAW